MPRRMMERWNEGSQFRAGEWEERGRTSKRSSSRPRRLKSRWR